MCQLLSCCLSQLQTYHTSIPYSVMLRLGLCIPHFCLVRNVRVGLCQQGVPGSTHSWWREKGLGLALLCWFMQAFWFCQGHPYLTSPWPQQLSPKKQLNPVFVSLMLVGSALSNSLRDTPASGKQCPLLDSLGPHTRPLQQASKF